MRAKSGFTVILAGPDGAGKTTLAKQVVQWLEDNGRSARYVHCYQWYKNLVLIPWQEAKSRRRGEHMVLDRSIYDNVIELARKLRIPAKRIRPAIRLLSNLSRHRDTEIHRIVLSASTDTLSNRRPDERYKDLAKKNELYAALAQTGVFVSVLSDERAFESVKTLLGREESV